MRFYLVVLLAHSLDLVGFKTAITFNDSVFQISRKLKL